MIHETMIHETFDYKGYHIQRMTKDYLWYVTFNNKIVYWHQYRNDIKSWIDAHIVKEVKDNENIRIDN